MIRRILTLLALLLALMPLLPLSAQIVVKSGRDSASGILHTRRVRIQVRDSLSDAPLPNVIIKIAHKADTLFGITSSEGKVEIPNRFGKDSVYISAQQTGYRRVHLRTVLPSPSTEIDIRLGEAAIEIEGALISEDVPLVSSSKDTTVYNPISIRLLEGASLEDLLSRLPGIDIDMGTLYAGGRQVQKILVNGTLLFGSDIWSAMRLLDSEMVKQIKVYDEHAQDRLIEADTLGQKDHVINIVTKHEIRKIQDIRAGVSSGTFTQKRYDDRREPILGAELGMDEFSTDRPHIKATLDAGKNISKGLVSTSPTYDMKGDFNLTHYKKFKSRYAYNGLIDIESKSSETSYRQAYNAIDRMEASRSSTDDIRGSIAGRGRYSFQTKNKNTYSVNFSLAYSHNRSRYDRNDTTAFNSNDYISYLTDQNRGNTINGTLGFNYGYIFKKQGRTLALGARLAFNTTTDKGETTDTLKASSYPQFKNRMAKNMNISPEISLSYAEPLVKGLYAEAKGEVRNVSSQQSNSSFDLILQQEDGINTYNYSHNRLEGLLTAGIRYNSGDRTVNLTVAGTGKTIRQDLREKYGDLGYISKTYLLFSPELSFRYTRPSFNLSLGYRENEQCPYVEQLRNTINYTNPMMLHAGNPDLKLPVKRSVNTTVHAESFAIGTAWNIKANFNTTSNYLGRNTIYFSEDTPLPEYDYTADAGSQLTRPENIGNDWKGDINVEASFNALKSSFRISAAAEASETPFITASRKYINGTKEVRGRLLYNSLFSSKLSLALNGSYGYGTNTRDGSKVYNYSDITAGGYVQLRLKNCSITADYGLNTMITDREGAGYFSDNLNLNLGYSFGRRSKYLVNLCLNDILNSRNSKSVSMNDLYIRTATNTILGRNILIRFTVNLKRYDPPQYHR